MADFNAFADEVAGLAQARLDAFVTGVINAVISAAFKTYL